MYILCHLNQNQISPNFEPMSLGLILALLLIFLAVAFSLQNAVPITIQFFAWTFEGSLVLVLLTALALGVIISLFASLPSQIKKNRLIVQQHKRITDLEQSLTEHKRSQMRMEHHEPSRLR